MPLMFTKFNPLSMKLLSQGMTNAKTKKNELETHIMYLAPSTQLAGFNLCPKASKGCSASCLYTAGRGRFNSVQKARLERTKLWAYDRTQFYHVLLKELDKLSSRATRLGKTIAVRLNGTSDIDHVEMMLRVTGIDVLKMDGLIFYDYTKCINYINKYKGTAYKFTFSRSECNDEDVDKVLSEGGNVAVVFKDTLPDTWRGYKVINGDETDLRYFDPTNVVVGLKAKGEAKKDTSNFVVCGQ